jgi:TonB-dependent receptor
MKFNPKLTSKALFTIVGGAVLINPVFAQDQGSEELEEVVVTGMRGSLKQSMEIKRDSIGVVDAITAEDIGKFPDTNLAESLQRIPGVSIDRQNGEGSQITVRGFGPAYNLVTLNGRTVATAEVNIYGAQSAYSGPQGRSFDFSNIAAEAVSALEVYKTGQALLPSGGIGATINVKTRRPFDTPGTQGSIGVKALTDTSNEEGSDITPEVSGLFNWTNEGETLGFGVFGAYAERDSGAAMGQTNGWNVRCTPTYPNCTRPTIMADGAVVKQTAPAGNFVNMPPDGALYSIPDDSRYDVSDLTEKRTNAQAVFQFRPADSITMTLDYTYFQNKTTEMRMEQTNWFNTPFDHLTFQTDDEGKFYHAIYLQENDNGAKDMGFEQTNKAQKDDYNSVGFNVEWALTDTGTLKFDAHSDTAKSSPDNPLGNSATFVAVGAPVILAHELSWDNGDHFPVQTYTIDDGVKANDNGVLDVGDLATQQARTTTYKQKMDVDEFDLRYSIKSEKSTVDFGANYRATKIFVHSEQTGQDLGSWGIANPGDIEQIVPGAFEAFCMSCRFDDFPVGQANIAFKADAAKIFGPLTTGTLYGAQAVSHQVNENEVDEDIMALYAQFGLQSELLGRNVSITGGLRYEKTEVDATAAQAVPERIRWLADNDFTIDFAAGSTAVTGSGSYNHILPNIDIKMDVTDKLVARISYSETIGRVPYGSLFAATTAQAPNNPTALGGLTSGSSQDPSLLPLQSQNFDASVEWYYGDDSYVSVGFFDKTVKNFLGNSVVSRPLFGLLDPSSGAPGSRSGDALAIIKAHAGTDQSPANLFTLVALMDKYNGDRTQATNEWVANLGTGGAAANTLPQSYIDSVLAAYDVVGDSADPEMQFRVNQPVNSDEGNINGWEFSWQHFFGGSGFGAAASYTIVDGDVNADPNQDPNANQFALVGLSDSANLTLMYEKFGVSARLAYNWRDDFLNATNTGNNGSGQFTEAYGQWDMSVSYDINDHIQVQFEGINLTGEDHREYRRYEGMTVWAYELAPRYALGARYKF